MSYKRVGNCFKCNKPIENEYLVVQKRRGNIVKEQSFCNEKCLGKTLEIKYAASITKIKPELDIKALILVFAIGLSLGFVVSRLFI